MNSAFVQYVSKIQIWNLVVAIYYTLVPPLIKQQEETQASDMKLGLVFYDIPVHVFFGVL
jgi:hypothetical protein